ncbi:MAG: BsuBI/PstI family type II restriction endonuclease [Saprospiraceae bacterium]
MKQYIHIDKIKTLIEDKSKILELINTTLYILDTFGIPLYGTPRRLQRMASVFLASGDIKSIEDFKNAKDLNDGFVLKSKEIVIFINDHFGENLSLGGNAAILGKDLKLLTVAGVVLSSIPDAATNDSTRGYSINPTYAELIRNFGSENWEKMVAEKLKNTEPFNKKLKRERDIAKVKVTLPSGGKLTFSSGEHNDVLKAIIEEFLPRYGHGAEVLYIGTTSDKYLYLEMDKLEKLNFLEISHEELPDVIAYSKEKNWVYLIEAVHSSGSITELRYIQLQKLTKDCNVGIVYVSAFLDKAKFRYFMTDIAWETEVWIADNPDHLIHFNGNKFLGPYKTE